MCLQMSETKVIKDCQILQSQKSNFSLIEFYFKNIALQWSDFL